MAEKEKLGVKITVTMAAADKANLDRDLHDKIARGLVIAWPPRLEAQKRRAKNQKIKG